jgi:hypothetical protein
MAGRNYQEECGDYGGNNGECGLAAGWGTDFADGKCKHHRGTSPDGESHAANDFGASHELYADHNTYYQRRDETGQRLIDDIFDGYYQKYTRVQSEEPTTGDELMLFRCAVDIHKTVIKADDWAAEKPASLDAGHPLIDRSERRSPQGEEYFEYVETAVAKAEHRISTRCRQWLKDMDLLGADDDGPTVNVNIHEELLAGLKAAHGHDPQS